MEIKGKAPFVGSKDSDLFIRVFSLMFQKNVIQNT